MAELLLVGRNFMSRICKLKSEKPKKCKKNPSFYQPCLLSAVRKI